MPGPIKVFVSYSHQDAGYLDKGSLLSFLKGLEKDSIEFWADKSIRLGGCWDDEINTNIRTRISPWYCSAKSIWIRIIARLWKSKTFWLRKPIYYLSSSRLVTGIGMLG
jgi:hypothetical protein